MLLVRFYLTGVSDGNVPIVRQKAFQGESVPLQSVVLGENRLQSRLRLAVRLVCNTAQLHVARLCTTTTKGRGGIGGGGGGRGGCVDIFTMAT